MSGIGFQMPERTVLSSEICRLASVGSVILVVHTQPMPKPTAIGAILIIGPGAAVTGDAGRMVVG